MLNFRSEEDQIVTAPFTIQCTRRSAGLLEIDGRDEKLIQFKEVHSLQVTLMGLLSKTTG